MRGRKCAGILGGLLGREIDLIIEDCAAIDSVAEAANTAPRA
jgi:hypothetical protein